MLDQRRNRRIRSQDFSRLAYCHDRLQAAVAQIDQGGDGIVTREALLACADADVRPTASWGALYGVCINFFTNQNLA